MAVVIPCIFHCSIWQSKTPRVFRELNDKHSEGGAVSAILARFQRRRQETVYPPGHPILSGRQERA